MKILIVDDEALARTRLRTLVEEIGGHEVVAEADNGELALSLSHDKEPDVVLLDIRMPVMEGIEAAMHISKLEHPPAIIFTTAYNKYALEAFQSHAVDYLLKPVKKSRLAEALEQSNRLTRAQLQAMGKAETGDFSRTHISARSRGTVNLIRVDDILYFQADQKYVKVRHTSGTVLIDESVKSLEEEFSSAFLRIHRSALVAHSFIEGLEKDRSGHCQVILRGVDDRLEISRRHMAEVRKALKQNERRGSK